MRRLAILPLLGLPLLFACGQEATAPEAGGAHVDPATGQVVLSRTEGPDGTRLSLVGRHLQADASSGRVSLDVSIRNDGDVHVFGPFEVRLHSFRPARVTPANADHHYVDRGGVETWVYGYDAVDSMGIGPGGETAARQWQFDMPELAPFSFGARIGLAHGPATPSLGGMVYLDDGYLGPPNADRRPFAGGIVELTRPDGSSGEAVVGDEGRYRFPLAAAGLHELRYLPPPSFAPVCFTTPNPLQVVVTAGEDGQPEGYLRADFGVDPSCGGPVPPVRLFSGKDPDAPRDPWSLLAAGAQGSVVRLRVGISGCGPDHPFALFASTDFMESEPVQVRAFLAHDDLDQLCDAWFERELRFDASPLLRAHAEAYGAPGPVVLRLELPDGTVQRLLVEP